ncbi:MAG: hypothetical protein QOD06_535 [Candidatus Binatota bacterium]|jgi:hypothetical protein|nr:hypothetical protein [Candidatus Binatota bacterium]
MTPRDLRRLSHRALRCFSESLLVELTFIHTSAS